MRKKGFTLAEALIALGIVAIVAALALPMFNKTKPDPVKVSYLKTYDSIVSTVGALVKNPKLYPMQRPYLQNGDSMYENFNSNATYYDYPLLNMMKAKDAVAEINLEEGNKKLCDAFFYSFGGSTNSCKDVPPPSVYKDENFTPSFTTKDGTEFMINTRVEYKPQGTSSAYTNALYETTIYFDIDGKKGNNCLYDKESCTSPDRFKVFVLADGTVKVADPVGKKYLKSRNLLNKITLNIGNNETVDTDAGREAILAPDTWCSATEGIQNGQNCEPCEAGYVVEGNDCKPCEGDIVNGICKTCESQGKTWNGSGCEPCEGPIENGTCQSCESQGKLWDASTGRCYQPTCTGGKVWNPKTLSCNCPVDKPYWMSGVLGFCSSCDPKTMPTASGNIERHDCVSGEWVAVCKAGYTGPECLASISVNPPSTNPPNNDDDCVDKPELGIYCHKTNVGGTTYTGSTGGGGATGSYTEIGDYDGSAANDIINCHGAACGSNFTNGNFITGTGGTTQQTTGSGGVPGFVHMQTAP